MRLLSRRVIVVTGATFLAAAALATTANAARYVVLYKQQALPGGELDSDKLMQELEDFLRRQREGGAEG